MKAFKIQDSRLLLVSTVAVKGLLSEILGRFRRVPENVAEVPESPVEERVIALYLSRAPETHH